MGTHQLSPNVSLWQYNESNVPSSDPYYNTKTFYKENKWHTIQCLIYIKNEKISKFTTVDTTNLQPRYLLHLEFTFYNFASIRDFTIILTGVWYRIRIIWNLPPPPSEN